jgi:hypothetical protein
MSPPPMPRPYRQIEYLNTDLILGQLRYGDEGGGDKLIWPNDCYCPTLPACAVLYCPDNDFNTHFGSLFFSVFYASISVLLNEAVCVRQISRQAKNKHFFLLFHPYLSSLPTTKDLCCTVACSILLITTGSSSIICCSPRILWTNMSYH